MPRYPGEDGSGEKSRLESRQPDERRLDYFDSPALLLAEVEGFEDSLEYNRLNETELTLPGVIAATFTMFLLRFQNAALEAPLEERDEKCLDDAYRAIETLLARGDQAVCTMVEDEIFWCIRARRSTTRSRRSCATSSRPRSMKLDLR